MISDKCPISGSPACVVSCLLFFWVATASLAQESAVPTEVTTRGDLIVVIGSAGEEKYLAQFNDWASRWNQAATAGNLKPHLLGANSLAGARWEELQSALMAAQAESDRPLWLVFIGHGTFDGKSTKFNLQGPDLTPQQLAEVLKGMERPIAIINSASASGQFLDVLSAPNRVVITSTKSSQEVNFTRFGNYLSLAISNPAADLDKDEQTSLLEAFLFASRETQEFYVNDGRLASEHALIDDNADGRGTRGAAFRGVRAVADPADQSAILDGLRAHQWHLIANEFDQSLSPEVIQQRNFLELQLAQLMAKKDQLPEDDYYSKLEELLVEMARLLVEGDAEPQAEKNAE